MQITKEHLSFLEESKRIFQENLLRETHMNEDGSLIALRYGADRDCIKIFELGEEVAFFVNQIEPAPLQRKVVREFAYDMEKQLVANDHKGGWKKEHWCDLALQLECNLAMLRKELIKANHDKQVITIRCANIANFAMMIADNKGEHL